MKSNGFTVNSSIPTNVLFQIAGPGTIDFKTVSHTDSNFLSQDSKYNKYRLHHLYI